MAKKPKLSRILHDTAVAGVTAADVFQWVVLKEFARRRIVHLQNRCSIDALRSYDSITFKIAVAVASGCESVELTFHLQDFQDAAFDAAEVVTEVNGMLVADGLESVLVFASGENVNEAKMTVSWPGPKKE